MAYCLVHGIEIGSKEEHFKKFGCTIFGKDGKDVITEKSFSKYTDSHGNKITGVIKNKKLKRK